MQGLSIRGILGDTVANTKRGFGSHFAYALAPALLSSAAGAVMMRVITHPTQPGTAAQLVMFSSPVYWAGLLLGVLCGGWALTGIIGSLLQRDAYGASRIGQMLPISASNLARYLGLYLLWYLALTAGFLLLVVPGFIVLATFAAALPAMVDRNLGPWDALQESRRLTKGKRLKTLASLIIFLLVLTVPVLAIGSATGLKTGTILRLSKDQPIFYSLMTLPIAALLSVLLSAYLVALYHRLGAGSSERSVLQEVFS